jgi:hypothetical protein
MATIDRPFRVLLDTAGAAERLEIILEFPSPIDDDAQLTVSDVMTTFAKLGASGALAGDKYDPGASITTLEHSEVMPQRSLWVFRAVHIDPASVCIVLNMIHYIYLQHVPVATARIAWSEIAQLEDPLAIQFPQRWRRLSFPLEFGELLDDIEFAVEFAEPQSDEISESVVDAMSVWLLATHRGAYADDAFNPAKTAVFLGPDVMEVSSHGVVWFIEIMRCHEDALEGLVNLLERVHQRLVRIRQVEIGP